MSTIKVLHVAWNADYAGMLTGLVGVQKNDPGLVFDVCFGTRGKGIFAEQMEKIGICPHILGMRSRYSLIESIKGGLGLRRIIREGNYDIIHLQEAMIPFPFLAAARTSDRARIVLHNRGEFNRTETFLQWVGQGLKKLAYRLIVPYNVDRLICNSRFTADRTPLSPVRHSAKIEVLYNAVPLAEIERMVGQKEELRKEVRREQGLPEDAFLATVVARLVEFKRIDRFIRAFTEAARTEPGLTALIVGTGPLSGRLAGHIKKSGLGERIRLLGHRHDAKKIIAASDLFILPSAGEAFGIAALEAVALQVPVIVFADAGGPLEFIIDGKNGFIVPDENALARRIVAVKREPAMLAPVSDPLNACGGMIDYARRIKEIYQELLAKRNGGDARLTGAEGIL